jgi:hypothetical protein
MNEENRVKIASIIKDNDTSAEILSKLYMKLNTRPCPNIKCGVPIYKE